jgi:hypothetical protein
VKPRGSKQYPLSVKTGEAQVCSVKPRGTHQYPLNHPTKTGYPSLQKSLAPTKFKDASSTGKGK